MPAPLAPAPVSTRGTNRGVKAAGVKGPRASAASGAAMAALPRSRLQFLLDIAQATFSQASPPTAQQIDALRRTLSSVPLEELGFAAHQDSPPSSPDQVNSSSSSRSSSPSLTDGHHALLGSLLEEEAAAAAATAQAEADACLPRPPITYLLIYEDERVSLGIFCLPARARIPLHNHPGMTVMSRVLYGDMHVSSYDWAQQQQQQRSEAAGREAGADAAGGERLPRPARVVLDRTLSASDPPVVLFPHAGGNIHQFTAITDCAVLDLMSPPYSTEDGRDCTYYSVVPASQQGPEGVVLLDAYEPPVDFVINQGNYRGVQPRPKLLPLFAGTSLFPAASGGAGGQHSPTASTGETAAVSPAAAAAAAAVRESPSPPPSGARSPVSSPTSEATGVPKLSSLLAGGGSSGGAHRGEARAQVYDCAASARCDTVC